MINSNISAATTATAEVDKEYLLTIDVGNSTIVAAVIGSDASVVASDRIHTEKHVGVDYYIEAFNRFFNSIPDGNTVDDGFFNSIHDGNTVDDADGRSSKLTLKATVLSSVVPELNDCISEALRRTTGMPVILLDDALIRKVIDLDVDEPSAVGKDRICDAVGAFTHFTPPFIAIDMGTATTVNVVNADGCFVGGMIIPGVRTSHEALSQKASQLPDVPIKAPDGIIGKNTTHCLQSGIVFGYASMIDGIISRIASEMGMESSGMSVVATGGMAHIIVPHCLHKTVVDRYLLQKGMCKIVNFI